jgi:hypothetical protein
MPKRSEYRDPRQYVPEIDGIRAFTQPPHWAACQQRPSYRVRPRHDADQRHERQRGPRDDHQGWTIGVVPVRKDRQEHNGWQRARCEYRAAPVSRPLNRTIASNEPTKMGSAFVSLPKYSCGSYFTARLSPR